MIDQLYRKFDVCCDGRHFMLGGALFIGAALVGAHASLPAAAPDRPAAPAERTPILDDRPASPSAYFVMDDFEDARWPDSALWPGVDPGVGGWWPSECRARTGRRSLWAFGKQADGTLRACTAAGVPAGTRSTILQRLDLRGARMAARLELQFDAWIHLPAGGAEPVPGGLWIFLLVPGSGGSVTRVPIFGATSDSAAWVYPARQLDLMNLVDIVQPRRVYDLRGGEWLLEWMSMASSAMPPASGVFIDNVRLVWEPDAAIPVPTARPTVMATATTRPPTATATATPSPGATSTAMRTASATATAATPASSATPTAGSPTPSTIFAWLPIALWELPPPPTPTPTPTVEVTPEPTMEATAGPTGAATVAPTSEATAAPTAGVTPSR